MMADIMFKAGTQIIQADNLIPFIKEVSNQIWAYETSSSCYKYLDLLQHIFPFQFNFQISH